MLHHAASALLVLVMAYAVGTSNGISLQVSINICCNNGTDYAIREGTCEAVDGQPIPDIGSEEEEDLDHCRIIMRSCCVQVMQKGMCIKGIDHRATNGSCSRVQPDGCASIEKTCCECCELGMKAYLSSAPCDGTDLGTECDFAFRECCQRASVVTDRNECGLLRSNNLRLCSMKCVNLIGSYVCECPDGYTLASDEKTCTRDEVSSPCDTSYCEQRCTPGDNFYTCECNEGFVLNDDGHTCRQASASLACMFASCSYGCRPVGLNSYECYCEQGYDWERESNTCVDKNECEEIADVCPDHEVCHNTVGSFQCILQRDCSTGFLYNPQSARCEDIDECQEENICPLHKLCRNYQGGFYCQTTKCLDGEHYDMSSGDCRDVDECAKGLHDCAVGTRCENLRGSYRCARTQPCGTGYTVNATTQVCDDIDECFQDTDDCPPNFYCQNTIGSYKCKPCRQGFKADNTDGCTLDVDECEDFADACPSTHTCVNTVGSYQCNPSCQTGYQYSQLYRACRDVNECALGLDDCRPNQICRNQPGTFQCDCAGGMELNTVTRDCDDIDECERETHDCQHNEVCSNREGSFVCQRRCQRNYMYDEVQGCVDINECEKEQYPCLGNSQCVNLPGSFRCQLCPRGQVANRDQRRCEDVDECNYEGVRCIGGCKNTFGSYACTCPSGYEAASRFSCRDVDECRRNIHNCSSQSACFNTRGGFRCKNIQCPQYFRKQITGEEVRCIKVNICPNNDLACIHDPIRLITHMNIALPSITRELTEPLQILQLIFKGLSYTQLDGLDFVLTQGNERGLFSIEKTYRQTPDALFSAIGTLNVVRSVLGPYETDLRMEMQLFSTNNELLSISVAVYSIDIGVHPF